MPLDPIKYGHLMVMINYRIMDFPFMGGRMCILDIYFGCVLAFPIAMRAGLWRIIWTLSMSKRVSNPMVKVSNPFDPADEVFIPRKLRSDHGTETVELYGVHYAFHEHSEFGDPADCYTYGRSVHNQKIECYWSGFITQWLCR